MRKSLKQLPLVLWASTFLGTAAVADDYFYLGGSVGKAFTKAQGNSNLGARLQNAYPASPTTNALVSSDNTSSAGVPFGVKVGYQFDTYWGVEVGYLNLGKSVMSNTSTLTQTVSPGNSATVGSSYRTETKMQGAEGAVVAHYPIDQGFGVLAKIGFLYGQYKRTDTSSIWGPTTTGTAPTLAPYQAAPTGNNSYSKFSPVWGLGARYAFTPTINVNLMYTNYGKLGKSNGPVGDGSYGKSKVSTVMLGVDVGLPY